MTTEQNHAKVNIEMLKEALKDLEAKEAAANIAESAYDLEPENTEKESAFDEAYKIEWAAFMAAANILAGWIGIDGKTARAMINGKRAELWDILNRAA